jgi:hypothetical protein
VIVLVMAFLYSKHRAAKNYSILSPVSTRLGALGGN